MEESNETQVETTQTGEESTQAPATQEAPAFEPITSQEALDAAVSAAIGRRYGDYESIKAELQTANARVRELEHSAILSRVAEEENIPKELISRLRGETEAEIREDARLLAQFVQKKPIVPKYTREPAGGENSKMPALKELLSGLDFAALNG